MQINILQLLIDNKVIIIIYLMSYYNDQRLQIAVQAIFNKYDKDGNGYLDLSEITQLLNDALSHMNHLRSISQ